MPTLPSSTSFTDSSVTEGQFKTAITNLREYLNDQFGATGTKVGALSALGATFGTVTNKAVNYTVLPTDRGTVIQGTGTITLTLSGASTLGAGFNFIVNNIGTGSVTIDPAGAETIDNQATKELSANQCVLVYCDGVEFYTVGSNAGGGGASTIATITANGGTVSIPAGITSCKITVIGGGGAGGNGVGASISSAAGGGGGGSGGSVVAYFKDFSNTTGRTVSCTAMSVAGTTTATFLGITMTATSGSVGSAGTSGNIGGLGGTGGSGSASGTISSGSYSAIGYGGNDGNYGGYAGTSSARGGTGGASIVGGAGRDGRAAVANSGSGGGGGAGSQSGGSNGSAGSAGRVIIEY